MVRGNNKQEIFRDIGDKRYYLALLNKFRQLHNLSIYHYCLMNNHLHLILQALSNSQLSTFMKRTNLAFFYFYSRKYAYCGHLFQNRFKSVVINNDPYLMQCGKYIELNPVRAKMVESPDKYVFSSFRYYAFGSVDPLVTPDPIYVALAGTAERRRNLYQSFVVDPQMISHERLRDNRYIGAPSFIEKAEALFGLPNLRKPVGRPRKL